jgi:hypothetical protein
VPASGALCPARRAGDSYLHASMAAHLLNHYSLDWNRINRMAHKVAVQSLAQSCPCPAQPSEIEIHRWRPEEEA